MKLKNKKTGEIRELPDGFFCGDNLKKICEEWEDYVEPKGWWYIDIHGPHKVTNNDEYYQQVKAASKEIGNYFETKEEAEKAVAKLKALKRLKDKGFRFILDDETEMPMFVYSGANGKKCITSAEESKQCRDDIKLLFGGEK